jgi:group I intron endonuclease
LTTSAYYIYLVTNTITGKQYIGFTNDVHRRIRQHFCAKDNLSFHPDVRRYGKDVFDVDVIFEYDDLDFTLDVMEPYFIDWYDTYENGYNTIRGGSRGRTNIPHSNKTKTQISISLVETYTNGFSEEHRKNLSASAKTRHNPKRSKEARSNLKAAAQRRKKPVIGTDPSGTEHRFSSATDAARALGFSRPHIVRCCGGHRPHHHGWKFSYE